MLKRMMMLLSFPVTILVVLSMAPTTDLAGARAFGAGGAGGAGGSGGSGNNGGGTKVYASNDDDVKIFVDPVNTTMSASGAMGTARSEPFAPSGTKTKEIGCWIDSGIDGAMVTCQAIVNGSTLRCTSMVTGTSSDPFGEPWGNGLAQATGALNGDSYIIFYTDLAPGETGTGNCVGLTVDNNSKYYPRVP